MKISAYFIKINNFKSKKNNKEYFTIEYLEKDTKKYRMEFIDQKKFEEVQDMEPDFLEEMEINLVVDEFRNVRFDEIVG